MHGGMRARVVLLMLLASTFLAAEKPPWRARRRPDVRPNENASTRVEPDDWAPEPASPDRVDTGRFAGALEAMCGWMPRGRPQSYADWMLRYGAEFEIDPFLLGALAFRESRCRPDLETLGGVGLTLVVPPMYREGMRKGAYHYRVREGSAWVEHSLPLGRFAFGPVRLAQAEPNLYFAAALLSAWRAQHESIDAAFPQVPHRHWVSHWVWGDQVRSARAEDRVLTDRRRLLQAYGALAPSEPIVWRGLPLGAPLDGAPRVVSSGIGFAREGGREHRGIDVESVLGEPVRAIADGRVSFSGVDLPGRQNYASLPPEETNAYDRKLLGNGGRYVCLLHEVAGGAPLRSCSMHLDTVEVAAGDVVTRSQRIGTVGRTGMRESSPHLHLEMHLDGEVLDASKILRGHLIGDPQELE